MSAVLIATSMALAASASSHSTGSIDLPWPLALGLMGCCFLLIIAMMFGLGACLAGFSNYVEVLGKGALLMMF